MLNDIPAQCSVASVVIVVVVVVAISVISVTPIVVVVIVPAVAISVSTVAVSKLSTLDGTRKRRTAPYLGSVRKDGQANKGCEQSLDLHCVKSCRKENFDESKYEKSQSMVPDRY